MTITLTLESISSYQMSLAVRFLAIWLSNSQKRFIDGDICIYTLLSNKMEYKRRIVLKIAYTILRPNSISHLKRQFLPFFNNA
jgi:hypothetical protein